MNLSKRGRAKGPLRKITGLVLASPGYDYDKVELECGHVIYATGMYRARCWRCEKDSLLKKETE